MSRRLVIILGCLGFGVAVILGGFVLFIKQFSQPSQAIIKVGNSGSSPPATITVSLVPTLVSDRYASFDYPAGLNLKTGTQIYPPSVATLDYSVKDVESWFLAVDISSNPSGNLSNNSAYLGRVDNPTEFHQSNTTINGQPVIIFTDTQAEGFSQIAFLVHGTWLATVSLIGDDVSGTQPLQTSFNMVLQTWHWLV